MARFLVICLILSDAFLILSMADNIASSASSPSKKVEGGAAEAPAARRLGKHQHRVMSFATPALSPVEAPEAEEKEHFSEEAGSSGHESETAQAQGMEVGHHHHHSIDKSFAGGGVILGGLATTFFVAIACYIRATRRKTAAASAKNAEPSAQV